MTIAETLQELSGMPGFLEDAAGRFSAASAVAPGPDGGFSFLEQVWHLADLEERGYGERVRRILREERPALADFDGAREAAEGRYRERELAAGLAAFRRAREANLAALRAVAEAHWSRPAMQDGVGALTLADVPRMMAEHDASHRAEVRELLGEAPPGAEAPRRSSAATAAALVLLVLPLLGCPYSAPFPIGTPAETPRDARLLGDWQCVTPEGKNGSLTISPLESAEYAFVLTAPAGEKEGEWRGHVASLKGTSVLNYREVKDGKPEDSWGFVRYLVPTPNSLVLDLADDELLKGLEQTPKAIGAAMDGPRGSEIFEPLLVCTRPWDRK
jgi:hypothetical protein